MDMVKSFQSGFRKSDRILTVSHFRQEVGYDPIKR